MASLPPYAGGPLRDRVIVITGAGSGIGRATAAHLAGRGARVVACDIDADALEALGAEAHPPALLHRMDVADPSAWAALAEQVADQLGPTDVLINNAGVAVAGELMAMSLDDWTWMRGINLDGVVFGCHAFVPGMLARGGGHVVNIASAAGLTGVPTLGAYSVTKCAVVAYSEALAAELAEDGVRVSAICPGFLPTRILEHGRGVGRMATPGGERAAQKMLDRPGRSPAHVARVIERAIVRNRFLVPIYAEAWAVLIGRRLSPTLLAFAKRRMVAQNKRVARQPD